MQDSANKIYGKLPAFVVDNADPEGLGRLRVQVPTLLDDPLPSWALPCVAYAGEDEDGRPLGLHLIPPPGTRIWVEFAGGDLNHPIWTGCFWDPAEAPGADADGVMAVHATEQITLKVSGTTITLNDTSIELSAETIRITADGDIELIARGDIHASAAGKSRTL